MLHTLPLLLLLTSLLSTHTRAQCPPQGPTLPLASNLTTNPTVQQALSNITALLQSFTENLNSTAVSIKIGTTEEALFEFHNAPTVFNTTGSKRVDGNTQFAIASISKLFTAYVVKILAERKLLRLGDAVTEYIPELLLEEYDALGGRKVIDAVERTAWGDVTLEALLGHEGGIAADLGDEDIDNAPGNYSAFGLPVLNGTEQGTGVCFPHILLLECMVTDVSPDFFTSWPRKNPVYAPFTTPVYSNVGYALLGLVIERVTGLSFAEYLQEAILEPLELNRTSVNRPLSLEDAFITAEMGDGDLDLGFEARWFSKSGGIYSTTNDIYSLGASILSTALLRPSTTLSWLKPRSFTSSSGTFVGEVWEIARGMNLTGGDGHIVDVYTKGGNLNLYSSLIALVPDYDLIFAVTSAGPDTSEGIVQVLLSQVLDVLIPALDSTNKAQAKERYAGTYTSGNDSITLSVYSGPGLLVQNFTVNGVNTIISNIGQTIFGASGPGQTTLRLYPTNLVHGKERTWQGVYDVLSEDEAEEEDALLFFEQGSCQTWSEISLFSYGLRALDQFVLIEGEEGRGVGVDARAWRTVLRRD
ncbi:hypothetical protein M409DRAFT_50885 [Zasmidium cellare ATCC 36951]|uniref:Uncharacterized protein n=1 Tax=Zasmidium cellare ATCC 36951 TaxID=1080233 RepID=A0A6A6CW75_ZASCE|nr:uncharacterized protein M409DRAFT_50885 [Zasmidium cellare ATCC 36951]KAF2171447.1 hypothetical protein M409DRAFT_50885 [Zasmidium cellare ATCC 36951]